MSELIAIFNALSLDDMIKILTSIVTIASILSAAIPNCDSKLVTILRKIVDISAFNIANAKRDETKK